MPSRQRLQQEYLFFMRIKNYKQQWIPYRTQDLSMPWAVDSEINYILSSIWKCEDFSPSSCFHTGTSYCSASTAGDTLPQSHGNKAAVPQSFPRVSHIPHSCHDCVPLPKLNPSYWNKPSKKAKGWAPCKITLCEYRCGSTENSFHTVSL